MWHVAVFEIRPSMDHATLARVRRAVWECCSNASSDPSDWSMLAAGSWDSDCAPTCTGNCCRHAHPRVSSHLRWHIAGHAPSLAGVCADMLRPCIQSSLPVCLQKEREREREGDEYKLSKHIIKKRFN